MHTCSKRYGEGSGKNPNPSDAKNFTTKLLALHEADPSAPQKEVAPFEDEVRQGGVD